VKNVDVLRSDAVGGQWQVSKTFFNRHLFLLGGEYRSVFAQNLHNSDIDVYLNKRTGSQVWAVYLQDEFELLKDVRLTAGVRYDRYSTFGGTVNPRVGVVYKPFDRTIFKLMYGQAFRAPSATELYYNDGGASSKPSSGLKPETTRTVELSLQQYLGFNVWGSAHVYYQRIKDLIQVQLDPSDGLLIYGNTKGAEQKGLELELEGRWQNGVRGRVSYALQETEDLESHKRVVNSPTHLIKINGVVPLIGEQLYLGVEEQFTSRRKTLAGNDAREFFITNVTLFNENWVKGLELSASVRNLFGRKYSDPGGPEHLQNKIQQNGRDFWFKLTYRF
jgi:iron complex outermembrane receptor protein